MAYVRKKNTGEAPKLDMTPMIDVVFQLLIFFIVTIKQEDILSQLSAARPAADKRAKKDNQPDLLEIIVDPQGFVFNGRSVTKAQLDRRVEQYSKLSKTAMIVIKCTADSPHGLLVQALDICNKHGMTNLSIFSI